MNRRAYPLSPEGATALARYLDKEWDIPILDAGKRTESLSAVTAGLYCGLRGKTARAMSSGWVEFRNGAKNKHGTVKVPAEFEYTSSADDDDWAPKTVSGGRAVPIPSKWTDHASGQEFSVSAPRRMLNFVTGVTEFELSKEAQIRHLRLIAAEINHRHDRPVIDRKPVEPTAAHSEVTTEEIEERYGGTIPNLFIHDLRATWTAHLLRGDVKRVKVRDLGGWSNMKMVDHYAQWVGDPDGQASGAF